MTTKWIVGEMSMQITVLCDQNITCEKTLQLDHLDQDVKGWGWGKVAGCDEHYCDTCWPEYCAENGVDVESGE